MTLLLDSPVTWRETPPGGLGTGGTAMGPATHLLDAYLHHCERRGFSDQTRRCYRLIVTTWLTWLDAHHLTPEGAGPAEVDAWLDSCALTTASSRATYLSWLRSFHRWAHREGLLDADPTAKLDLPLLPKPVARPLRETALPVALKTTSPRMCLWLLLGAKTGLRCKEIAGIHARDIHLDSAPPMLDVTNPKGRRQRTVPIHPDVVWMLHVWSVASPCWGGYLFPGASGRRFLSPGYLSKLIGDHLRGLGIDATAHQLRHRFGSKTYEITKDLRLTQELLGHASPATTMIYTHIDISKAADYWDEL